MTVRFPVHLAIVALILMSSGYYLFIKWVKAESREFVVKVDHIRPPYIISGEKPNQIIEYLDDLKTRANHDDCDAIYTLWEYYEVGCRDVASAKKWLKRGVECGCSQKVFLQQVKQSQ